MADSKKILIVEDEPDMVEWLKTFLEDNGFVTITAQNGDEGFTKAKTEKPDLITLDIAMDKQSGIKCYRNLCDSEETKNIPVIMVTGVAAEFKQFIESRKQVPHPAGYFEKPVEREDLLKKVQELLND